MFKIIIHIAFISLSLLTSGCAPVVAGSATAVGGVLLAQERSVGDAVSDVAISAKIKEAYLSTDINRLYHPIHVEVVEGRVLLAGTVESPEVRLQAVEIAWKQNGVKEVHNELEVNKPLGLKAISTYAGDSWITTRLKSKMLVDQDIRSVNYNIETIKAVVYIMGIAQSKQELSIIENMAKHISGVQKVVSYVRVKDQIQTSEESTYVKQYNHMHDDDSYASPVSHETYSPIQHESALPVHHESTPTPAHNDELENLAYPDEEYVE